MARIEKTVFISYRRTDVYTALAVYENLKNQGYDVFFDYRSISSGDFEQIITSNIRARAHFILILTPTALDRLREPGDWLRREIEIAIDEKRNIVPLFFKGFRFGIPSVSENLTGKLNNLGRYNGLNVHEDYFDEAMHRLRTQYLNIPLNTVLHPVSTEVRKVVQEEQRAADKALEQIEDVQELVKGAEVNLNASKDESDLKPVEIPKEEHKAKNKIEKPGREYVPPTRAQQSASEVEAGREVRSEVQPRRLAAQRKSLLNPKLRLFIGVASVLIGVSLCILAGVNSSINNLFELVTVAVTSSPTSAVSATLTSQPTETNTSSPTETSIASTPKLGIGSTITGKDGMTLLYVPAGEFTMGSDIGNSNEAPVHTVTLDAFWIDKTEVTNKMYSLCVRASVCKEPSYKSSNIRSSYYGDSDYYNYPVISVDWYMAKAYCEWAGRRLPTEAEWEKAARGPEANIYPWGNETPNVNLLNYNGYIGDTTEVGKYPTGKSIYGALDMAGNVSEWVSSLYKPYPYYPADGRENLTSMDERVVRGWAWNYDNSAVGSVVVRSAHRDSSDPTSWDQYIGFRCAMSAAP